jgi:hypothetical protein
MRSELTVIQELEPIRDAPGRQLAVRILDTGHGRRLDVREYVEAEGFSGYTRKGVCLTLEELNALLEQRDQIVRLLEGGGDAPRGAREKSSGD